MNIELKRKINNFIQDPSLGQSDINTLNDIITILLEIKFNRYRDFPIDFILLDRTQFEPMFWFKICYEHLAKTNEEQQERFQSLLDNLSMATTAIQQQIKLNKIRKQF